MRTNWLLGLVVVASCSGGDGASKTNACVGPLGDPIPASALSSMTACCSAEMGHAHCLAKTSIPSTIQPFLDTCDDANACVPDSFLETAAAVPPATCTAFGGSGVCLSKCIPQVAQNEGLLKPDTCAGADELCVPCISPLDQKPTGACDLLTLARCEGDGGDPAPPAAACDDPSTCAYDAGCPPVIDPSTFTACAPDAHCLDAALVGDPAEASQLAKCADGTSLCVPDTFIASGGKFVPPTCTSINGNEGRCLSLALPAVSAQASELPQDTCGANEKCTPCFDPITSAPTGACSLSCDTGPTTAAKPFTACCSARARCVPTTAIPSGEQGNLSQQECTTEELCVPDQILANGPYPTCSGTSVVIGDYTGVCLSDCLDFGFQGLALVKGTCASHEKCAPCEQGGQPTGAPGCPASP